MTSSIQRRSFNGRIAALGLGAALTVMAPFAMAQTSEDIKKQGEITIGMAWDLLP